ncbi:MAG: hypothetical protein K8R67_11735 [Desulfobacteraceae bacterium]|nr:hypothetical protein [Desulfobacteraceae bacterium]
MVATFAMTAAAAEWNFYGSARVATFWTDVDDLQVLTAGGDDDDFGVGWAMQGNSRIGAKVKVSDTLSGRFEYGTSGGGANIRLLYGTWNFGAGTLTVGQFYSPLNFFYSNQVYGGDAGMLNVGGLYSGRNQGLMVGLMGGALKIALLTPNAGIFGPVIIPTGEDVDATFPRFEVSYHLSLGKAFLDFAAGYTTYEVENLVDDYDVDSWVLAFGGGVDLGFMYIKANAWYGENVGTYGLWHNTLDDFGGAIIPTIPGDIDIEDNESYGLLFVVGAKINDMVSVEAGIGYTESELDFVGWQEDDNLAYYVQATVTLAPGVFIVPEVGIIDSQEDMAGADDQSLLYYGLKWQINF